jgi:hypothetical protein
VIRSKVIPGALTAALLILLNMSAGAQGLASGSAPAVPIVRILASLIICGLALFAILLFLRARGVAAGGGKLAAWFPAVRSAELAVLETRKISLHTDLCRFRISNEEFVVLVSSGHAEILVRRTLPPPPANGPVT